MNRKSRRTASSRVAKGLMSFNESINTNEFLYSVLEEVAPDAKKIEVTKELLASISTSISVNAQAGLGQRDVLPKREAKVFEPREKNKYNPYACFNESMKKRQEWRKLYDKEVK
jgi:hypothetical protein